jgi:hypothetical protein
MSALGHSRPSHFVPVLNNVRYASDSDHSRYESELTLWAISGLMHRSNCDHRYCKKLGIFASSWSGLLLARSHLSLNDPRKRKCVLGQAATRTKHKDGRWAGGCRDP